MSPSVSLKISSDGRPLFANTTRYGVLILPALAPEVGFTPGVSALFQLLFQLDAASPVTRNATLFTNVPQKAEIPFERSTYVEFPISTSFHKDVVIPINIYRPGTYSYYIEYDVDGGTKTKTEKYYFVVPPSLTVNGKYLAFNDVNIQLVVSKWIGPLSEWDAFFSEVAKKGYTMIHFTPLQERGELNSPYSIYDQLRFDPNLFQLNDEAAKILKDTLKSKNLLSLTDVVWNHTANNSAWLRDHPDAGYNRETAPHLRAAIELDAKLLEYSLKLEELGLPVDLTEENIGQVTDGLLPHVLDPLELWQYYVYNQQETISGVEKAFNDNNFTPNIDIPESVNKSDIYSVAKYAQEISGKPVVLLDRFSNKLDPATLLGVIFSISDLGKDTSLDLVKAKAGNIVDALNVDLYKVFNDDLATIKRQISDRLRYLRLDANGPKLGKITAKAPLAEEYFTRFKDSKGQEWALANNGWTWGGNPLVDFAGPSLKAYLRREVISWGDCVKLRYGNGPEDSPFVWEHMIKYTQLCAKHFEGFRIDNCHLTPLHVGERLLDEARKVNPNLYVVAELFLGSEEMDKIFVERLGINSLIREAMQAWNPAELSRLVHKHGGRPIGSFNWMPLDSFGFPADKEPLDNGNLNDASELGIPKNLSLQAPHALFMDCTHDNEVPAQKRTVEDTLPTAALVAFCLAAIGSVFGFDECYPALLDVVGETRQYTFGENGIGIVKTKLHEIRKQLASESIDTDQDNETYIHHEGQYITVQRYNSRTANGWFLVARSKFSDNEGYQQIKSPILGGTKVKGEFAYTLKKTGDYDNSKTKLNGIPATVEELPLPEIEWNGTDSIIHVDANNFPPGSIAVFSATIPDVDEKLDNYVKLGAVEASLDLNLYDLNAILYKCGSEELDNSDGSTGTYNIPQYGSLVYAGLQGWVSVLRDIVWNNDLAHALCNHLREGEWAFEYIVSRLDKYAESSPAVAKFQTWLRERFEAVSRIPYFLRPRFFAIIVGTAYQASRFRALRLLNSNIQTSTNFVQTLALTSIQMLGTMKSTSLVSKESVPSLAAGLPHFSSNYMRSWGRDVFILFRGLLLVTGRFDDAKRHILGFAQTLKHGLIPNLLDAGRNPRYNARDAAWFFAQAVQDYVNTVPDGIKILDEKVKRRFPLDDTWVPLDDERAYSYESLIKEVLYEILQRHAKGISYREANAGPNLDSQMTDEGFNVSVNVDWSNGLIFGGSRWNCGTWMDKMGESTRAGNKGYPGTPRDGAAVELQGLLKSTLRWVNELASQGHFPFEKVEKLDGGSITLKEWEELVQSNFERCFYVPETQEDDGKYEIDLLLVNRRGMYKDLFRSGSGYEDYQLRPNFAIAMTVAPELFSVDLAFGAVNLADQVIRGPLGMRTLDPLDWNYRPDYHNSVDNDDFATSKGRNYHQGPEWVWCMGYFFRAFLHFHHLKNGGESNSGIDVLILGALNDRMRPHMKWIHELPWAGLTELTNKDAAMCDDSSPTQAWSSSCLLDLYQDLWASENY